MKKDFVANTSACPLLWKPNEICPSTLFIYLFFSFYFRLMIIIAEVDDIAYLTFAVLGSAAVIGLITLGDILLHTSFQALLLHLHPHDHNCLSTLSLYRF